MASKSTTDDEPPTHRVSDGARTPESDGTLDIQVLEFDLADETYCIDIEYVAEIVDTGELTPVPNAPARVEGVMDLRGRTTTIVNPRRIFGLADDGERRRIVVFDPTYTPEMGATGWIVDEVQQVVRITDEDVDKSAVEADEAINGIVKRDGEFVIWVTPAELDTAAA